MEKLKRLILQLNKDKYDFIVAALKKNHSNKFLTLLEYNRNNSHDDLLKILSCNDNALYVLKSRLYDKIQKCLIDFENHQATESHLTYSANLDDYLVKHQRDTAIAMLHEIEKNYLQNNDYVNLINVYSTLKKAYHHSDKYYYYSQLYNKNVAYFIALEKANDVLLDFNKTLANYYFSDSEEGKEKLMLLKDEIKNICFLNNSHNLTIIFNIILIQLFLFTRIELAEEDPVVDIIASSDDIFNKFSGDPQVKKFEQVFDFLKMEYYHGIKQNKKTLLYFEKINENIDKWLLNSNYCLAYKFLFSKLVIVHTAPNSQDLLKEDEVLYHDPYDFYSIVAVKFYTAINKYYSGNLKEAITLLNKILDDSSFVNFPYIEFEIKLSLAFFYYKKKELDMGSTLLKNLSRKVAGKEYAKYQNVKIFIKILNLLIEEKETAAYHNKLISLLEQFNYYNLIDRKILQHLQKDIDGLAAKK